MDNDAGNNVEGRLIEAAEKLFSEKGFDGTSVRDLTSEADCNVAAINYYFGSKENLYQQVFRRRLTELRDIRLKSIRQVMERDPSEVTLENLLRAFANAFIEPLLDQSSGRRIMTLICREMLDPRLPGSVFMEEMIIPVQSALQQAMMKICPNLERTKALMSIHSLVAQLVHIIRVKAMFEQADSDQLPLLDLGRAVDHVVAFSAAGIRAVAGEKKNDCESN